MTNEDKVAVPGPGDDLLRRLTDLLLGLISNVPSSGEKTAAKPFARASALITHAALKSAGISGGLALPPGPLGLITILPDLYAIWRIQAQLVSDIAAAYGKSAHLTQETMLYCLFRHAAAQAVRDLVVRTGERVLVRRASLRVLQGALRRVGVITTQRVIGRGLSRWLPFIGAAGVAAYAYYDTRQVGRTAIDLFSQDIGGDGGDDLVGTTPPPSVTPTAPPASSAQQIPKESAGAVLNRPTHCSSGPATPAAEQ